jgi:hypothetical protein
MNTLKTFILFSIFLIAPHITKSINNLKSKSIPTLIQTKLNEMMLMNQATQVNTNLPLNNTITINSPTITPTNSSNISNNSNSSNTTTTQLAPNTTSTSNITTTTNTTQQIAPTNKTTTTNTTQQVTPTNKTTVHAQTTTNITQPTGIKQPSQSTQTNNTQQSQQVAYQNTKANEEDPYEFQKNILCTKQNCYYPYGICTDAKTCRCMDEYASYKSPDDKKPQITYCTYRRSKQLVAFLLEFFLPFGVGHFYCGRIIFGMIKLLLMISPCIFVLFFIFGKSDITLVTMVLMCLFGCGWTVWEIVDIVLFAINSYRDGNGVQLARW